MTSSDDIINSKIDANAIDQTFEIGGGSIISISFAVSNGIYSSMV